MTRSLRNVAALIATLTILQLSAGVIGARLPVAFAADGYSRAALGLVAASYSAGFMLGAMAATTLLARVGNIRVYAACAALFAAATLAVHFAGDVWSWGVVRMVAGVSMALMFASVESWLSGSIGPNERGEVLSVYMVASKAAVAVGPYLGAFYAPAAPEPWMIAAAIAALSMAPVCFTSAAEPEPPKATPLALADQFAVAPAAVLAAFGAGFMNSGILTLGPLYAESLFGSRAAADFYAAASVGSLLLQWPAGRISDRIDRRVVIAVLALISAAAAVAIALIDVRLNHWGAVALFLAWGAGALSFYGIAVAHMGDRADPGRLAQSAAGLLFVWAAGSVLGPISLGLVVDGVGLRGMFWFAAAAAILLAAAMLWRHQARESVTAEEKSDFAPHPASSVAAAEIAYGKDDPKSL